MISFFTILPFAGCIACVYEGVSAVAKHRAERAQPPSRCAAQARVSCCVLVKGIVKGINPLNGGSQKKW